MKDIFLNENKIFKEPVQKDLIEHDKETRQYVNGKGKAIVNKLNMVACELSLYHQQDVRHDKTNK